MHKKKELRLYNIGFHPIYLFLFPSMWIWSLFINFAVDSIFLIIGLKKFGGGDVKQNYRSAVIKTWLLGFCADLMGTLILFGAELLAEKQHTSIMMNPLGRPLPFLLTLLSVAVTGLMIYIFNLKIALKKTSLDERAKKKTAILMAVCTAPYLFFLPARVTR